MYILGITSGGESGAALFEDSKLLCAVNEERLSRKKLDTSYPHRSIDWCLKKARCRHEQISLICFGFSKGMRQGDFLTALFERAMDSPKNNGDSFEIVKQRLVNENVVDSEKRNEFYTETEKLFPGTEIYSCYHHEAHQANAFVPSPFEESLVVTADGRGDFQSLTISTANRKEIKEIYCNYSWESLGNFYGRITSLCGFKPNRHEGKVTGIAAKGDPLKAIGFIRKMVSLNCERYDFNIGDYYRPFFTNYSPALVKEASLYSREDLAAAAQYQLEEIMCFLVKRHLKQTGLRNVCLSGGVFANIKVNQKILELEEVSEVFVYPNMTDAGICTGAVYSWMLRNGPQPVQGFPSLYTGPEINPEELADLMRSRGIEVERPESLTDGVVNYLMERKIVGMVQGQTEFGPRALGNRSVLSTPFYPEQNDMINKRLDRDGFMPFAPSIASELAERCLKGYLPEMLSNRHMTLSYNATEEFKKNSPAVVHTDGTARPQIVEPEDNAFFHELLTAWYKAAGGLSLLNTSFNRHEEPIISTLNDIEGVVDKRVVDVLVFPPYCAKIT